jgi:hypothetical protein
VGKGREEISRESFLPFRVGKGNEIVSIRKEVI